MMPRYVRCEWGYMAMNAPNVLHNYLSQYLLKSECVYHVWDVKPCGAANSLGSFRSHLDVVLVSMSY